MSLYRTAATTVAATLVWVSTMAAQAPSDSTARRQQRTLDSLAAVLRTLQARIDSLVRAGGDTAGGDELAALRAAASQTGADSAAAAARPAQARLGQNALNPEITVTGDVRSSFYRPDPGTANFAVREFEIGFQAALDPWATAKVFAAFEDGEAVIEEGYVYFPALPGGFRLDLGAFRQEVGELNRWHLHALPEDEYPLVIRRFAGEEGLAATGVSVYWPLPFSGRAGTYELTVQATTGGNEVLYQGGSRPAVNGKLAAFWQLSRTTYFMASGSAAFGSNPDSSLKTQLVVAAARFTWRPPQRSTSRELTVRGEFWNLRRRTAGAGPTRAGWYADASWKLGRRFVASTRYDRVQSPDPLVSGNEWAVTPSLTFWQSEFVYIRGNYEHARDFAGAKTNRLTLQAVFAMGPHKHELF